jgi:hypothetical protein
MRRTVAFVLAVIAASGVIAAAQQPSVLPMGPPRERGASITPAFEGWYQNDDGSFTMLVGYYNRNSQEPMTIPIRVSRHISKPAASGACSRSRSRKTSVRSR